MKKTLLMPDLSQKKIVVNTETTSSVVYTEGKTAQQVADAFNKAFKILGVSDRYQMIIPTNKQIKDGRE